MQAYASIIFDLQKLIAGLQEHPPPAGLVIGSRPYTTAQAIAIIQGLIDKLRAAVAARNAYKNAITESEAEIKTTQPFLRDLRHSLQITYGDSSATLGDFGLVPRKIGTRSPEVKLAAAEKLRATRKARNTMGPKQKKAIKGNVVDVIITPITADPPKPVEPG
jgi:hypothetical protein